MIRRPLSVIICDAVCRVLGFSNPQTDAVLAAFNAPLCISLRSAIWAVFEGGAR